MIVRSAYRATIPPVLAGSPQSATPVRLPQSPAGQGPSSTTPTGLSSADIDGGREGRDARRAADASPLGCVNTGRTLGAHHRPVNLANVDGGGRDRALPLIVSRDPARNLDDGAGHHRPIAPEPGNELLNDLADQPRFVTVGLRLAAHPGFGVIDIPMIFVPVFHSAEVRHD